MGSEPNQCHVVEPPIEIELTAEEALYLENLDLERRVSQLEAEIQVLRRTNIEIRREAFFEHLKQKLDADLGGELVFDLEGRTALVVPDSDRDTSSW